MRPPGWRHRDRSPCVIPAPLGRAADERERPGPMHLKASSRIEYRTMRDPRSARGLTQSESKLNVHGSRPFPLGPFRPSRCRDDVGGGGTRLTHRALNSPYDLLGIHMKWKKL